MSRQASWQDPHVKRFENAVVQISRRFMPEHFDKNERIRLDLRTRAINLFDSDRPEDDICREVYGYVDLVTRNVLDETRRQQLSVVISEEMLSCRKDFKREAELAQ